MKTRQAIETAALLLLVLGLAIGCSFVDAPPVATFTYAPSDTKAPVVVVFDASASSDAGGVIVKYEWNFGDGSRGTDRVTTHTYSCGGTYSVCLTVTDDDGKTATMVQSFTFFHVPAAAHFTASPVSGLTVHFDASTSAPCGGGIVSYSWNFGDGSSGAGAIVDHTYARPDIYTVLLRVSSTGGASDSTTQSIWVTVPPPTPTPYLHAALVASATSGSPPLTVHFDGSGSTAGQGSIVSYTWSFGDGANGTGVTVSHTYASVGTYTARLIVVDSGGAADSATRTIQVTAAPTPVGAHAVLAASPTSGAAPLTVQFDASGSSAGQGSIVSYTWSFGDGANGTGVTVSHTYASVGTYTARLTVTDNNGATDSVTKLVQTTEPGPPRPPVTFSGHANSLTASFLLSEGLATFEMRHSGSSNFAVWLNSAAGGHVDLLVNVIGSYSGTALVGIGSASLGVSSGAYVLSVSADGDWEIKVRQLAYTSGATPPQSYGSTGDSVAGPFELRQGLATFEIAHTGQSNFSVWLYDTNGSPVDLLVNVIGSYSGTTLVGIGSWAIGGAPGAHVLAVEADGQWQINVRQPHYTSGAALPCTYSGAGDNVTAPFNLTTGSIEFTLTHAGSSNFAVWLYTADGEAVDLLANEIGAYSGSRLVEVQAGSYGASPGVHVLAVEADGSWSVTVRRR